MKRWWETVCLIVLLTSGYAAAENGDDSTERETEGVAEIAVQQEEKAALAVVNGEKITMDEYNKRLKQLSAYERARYREEEGHKEFLNTLVRQKLMVQKAEETGLKEDEEVRLKIEELMQQVTENVLVETVVKREVLDKAVVSVKEAKSYYKEHQDEFGEKEKAKARHILVETEEEALEVRQALEKGADFAELAKEKSIDQHTAEQGGELDYFERGRMLPEFEKACFDLKVGEISDIVKTRFGYHIIKLEDKQEASVKEFYEVSDEIKKKLIVGKQQEDYQKWLRQLEKEAEIEMNEDFFSN